MDIYLSWSLVSRLSCSTRSSEKTARSKQKQSEFAFQLVFLACWTDADVTDVVTCESPVSHLWVLNITGGLPDNSSVGVCVCVCQIKATEVRLAVSEEIKTQTHGGC